MKESRMHLKCSSKSPHLPLLLISQGEAVSSILVNLKVSSQHIEVNLSELKGYEKHVIAELIKEKNQKLPIPTSQHDRENCIGIAIFYVNIIISSQRLIQHICCSYNCCSNNSKWRRQAIYWCPVIYQVDVREVQRMQQGILLLPRFSKALSRKANLHIGSTPWTFWWRGSSLVL